eukprot:UN4569
MGTAAKPTGNICKHSLGNKKQRGGTPCLKPRMASDQGLVDEVVHEVIRPLGLDVAAQRLPAGLEPGHGVAPLAVEGLPPVKDAVVVKQHDVTLLHQDVDNVLLADLVDVADVLGVDAAEVAVVDIGHAHLRHSARAAITEIAAVVVDIAEPHRLARHRMPIDRRLGVLNGL